MEQQFDTLEDINQVFETEGFVLFRTGVRELWILDVLAEHFGSVRGGTFWQKNFEVKFDPADPASRAITDSVSQSPTEFPLHTDGSFEKEPPRVFFLQCVQNDLEGYGVSILVDIWQVVERLSQQTLKILLETPFQFQRTEKGITAVTSAPILEFNGISYNIRYRNDRKSKLIPPNEDTKQALTEFEQITLRQDMQTIKFLQPGDILMVNNQRMLHGRTALSGSHYRVLRRLWVD